jgi:hypothetical protein
MTDTTLTFRVDCGLKIAFAAMAEEQDMSAAQMLRRLMRDAVEKHEESAAHERWQRREIGDAMQEADVTHGPNLSNDAVETEWQRRKADIGHDDD